MKDHVLGVLNADSMKTGTLVGSVLYRGSSISLRLDADGSSLEACLELGRKAVLALESLDEKARAAASQSLLTIYNDDWREYQRADGEGGFEEVSDPALTGTEFASRISLRSLSIIVHDGATHGFSHRAAPQAYNETAERAAM